MQGGDRAGLTVEVVHGLSTPRALYEVGVRGSPVGDVPKECLFAEKVHKLLQAASAVKLSDMKRQLFTLILTIAVGLQGSAVAFAGISPLMSADCQTVGNSLPAASQGTCCPKGHHAMSCCLEACVGTDAGVAATTPQVLQWFEFATPVPQFLSTQFSSRGDSPLIRPPIL